MHWESDKNYVFSLFQKKRSRIFLENRTKILRKIRKTEVAIFCLFMEIEKSIGGMRV